MSQAGIVRIGISGWTGFAPLTLAKEAGIYKKNGLDVSIKKIPQKDRHLAIAFAPHRLDVDGTAGELLVALVQHGEVAETGTHDSLMALRGVYGDDPAIVALRKRHQLPFMVGGARYE